MLLDRSGWKVLAAPKAKPNYEVEKMFDEDINTFGYCNADEEQANPPYDFVIDLGKEVTVRGFQFNQRYMTTGKPEAGARYGIAHLEVWTAKEITGDGLGAATTPTGPTPRHTATTGPIPIHRWIRWVWSSVRCSTTTSMRVTSGCAFTPAIRTRPITRLSGDGASQS